MTNCRIGRSGNDSFVNVAQGIMRKAVVYGDKTLLCEFKLEKGSLIPNHTHPHEQTGYLVSGKMKFTIDGMEYEMKAGDSWCILGDIEHKAEVIEDSFVIEVFSPVREDFITSL